LKVIPPSVQTLKSPVPAGISVIKHDPLAPGSRTRQTAGAVHAPLAVREDGMRQAPVQAPPEALVERIGEEHPGDGKRRQR